MGMTIEEILNKYHVGMYVKFIMERRGSVHKITAINKDIAIVSLVRVFEFSIEDEEIILNAPEEYFPLISLQGNEILNNKQLVDMGIIPKSVDFITGD